MENDHLIDWSKVKILKVEHDYSKRLFTESWYINEKPQVLNRNDGLSFPAVYRKLLNSQCWIPFVLIFPSVSSNVFCCNVNSEKWFSYNRFLSFLYAPLHYLYDVAYRNNEFYRSLILNFFASYSTAAMCGIVFLFFAIRSWWRFAITTDSSGLKKLVVSN